MKSNYSKHKARNLVPLFNIYFYNVSKLMQLNYYQVILLQLFLKLIAIGS